MTNAQSKPQHQQKKQPNKQKVQSYAIGYNVGTTFKQQGFNLDFNGLMKGIKDALNGDSMFTNDELNTILTSFQKEKFTQDANANQKEAADFLANNKKNPDVSTTQSGLQYKIDTKGTGTVSPTETDTVVVHYHGTLVDGSEFDSSYKRNQPATFPVNGVIKGWTEALQLMKVGDEYTLYIPSELAYGEQGTPPLIGPYKLLIFKVKLEAINP